MAKKKRPTGIINETSSGTKGISIMTAAGSEIADAAKKKGVSGRRQDHLFYLNKPEEELDGKKEKKSPNNGNKKV